MRVMYSANQSLDMFSFVAIDGVTGLRSAETAWMHVVVTVRSAVHTLYLLLISYTLICATLFYST